jgi:hypothetical protein
MKRKISKTRADSIGAGQSRDIATLFRKLRSQPIIAFPDARGTLAAPCDPGVYVIQNSLGRVAHVGMTPTSHLHARLYSHLCGKSSFVQSHLAGDASRLRGNYSFQYLKAADLRKRALLEAYATGQLCPIHIRKSQVPDSGEIA